MRQRHGYDLDYDRWMEEGRRRIEIEGGDSDSDMRCGGGGGGGGGWWLVIDDGW